MIESSELLPEPVSISGMEGPVYISEHEDRAHQMSSHAWLGQILPEHVVDRSDSPE